MAGIKFKVLPSFPANVVGTPPIFVTKAGLQYTISFGLGNAVLNGGNTNNSNTGSGTDFDHDLTFSIPANFMIAKRAFRVSAHYQLTTGSTPPNLIHKLKLGSVVLLGTGGITPGPNQTNVQTGFQWIFQATQAPSVVSNVQCMAVESLNTFGVTGVGVTPMPVVIATNAVQVLKVSTQWSAVGTGITTIGLNQLIVETIN